MKTSAIIAMSCAVAFSIKPTASSSVAISTVLSPTVTKLSLHEGMSFLRARARLIKSGWVPTPMHTNDQYEYSGAEKRLIERNFREVDFCSIDRGALCILYYAKESSCLRIDTVGEQVESMRVTRWTEECPEGGPP